MTQYAFHRITGAIFGAVAFLHLLRLILRWEALIGGWVVPGWVSIVGLVIASYLSWTGLTLKEREK